MGDRSCFHPSLNETSPGIVKLDQPLVGVNITVVELQTAVQPPSADVGDALHFERGTQAVIDGLCSLAWELSLVEGEPSVYSTFVLHNPTSYTIAGSITSILAKCLVRGQVCKTLDKSVLGR